LNVGELYGIGVLNVGPAGVNVGEAVDGLNVEIGENPNDTNPGDIVCVITGVTTGVTITGEMSG